MAASAALTRVSVGPIPASGADEAAMSRYTQTPGSKLGNRYFMDVEISPATLKDGTLRQRFDTRAYSSTGNRTALGTATVVLTASTTTPVGGASLTLTVTCTAVSGTDVPTGTVTFKDGATVLGTATLNGSGVATRVQAAGLTIGPHALTAVMPADSNFASATSPGLTVTAS